MSHDNHTTCGCPHGFPCSAVQARETCPHESFVAETKVARLGDDTGAIRNFVAEISIRCTQCDQPFHFVGVDCGFAFTRPTVNVGATTLHAPIAPGEATLPERIRYELPPEGKS